MRSDLVRPSSLILALVLLSGGNLSAGDVGRLSGRFVLEGVRPSPEVRHVKVGDRAPIDVPDESLLVDLETHGVANIVVRLYLKLDEKGPPATAAPQELDEGQVMTLRNHRCEPRILLTRAGQSLFFENLEREKRTVKADFLRQPPFALALEPGKIVEQKLHPQGEKLPIPVQCKEDPLLRGYVIVTDHPFVAVTDRSGRFVIENVPIGEWTFRAWHEQVGYVQRVEIDGEPQEWKTGLFTKKIDEGENDLGWINLNRAQLRLK
jgi:hypothetical protein